MLAHLCVQVARAELAATSPYAAVVSPPPMKGAEERKDARASLKGVEERRDINALMKKLYGHGGESGEVPDPAEARRLLDEIIGKLRRQQPKGVAPLPVPAPPRVANRNQLTPPVVEPVVAQSGALTLGLRDFLTQVRRQNDQIVSQHLEFEIAGQGVVSAQSVFELTFVSTGVHEENSIRNTVEQALQRTSQSEFMEYNERWDAAFEKLFETGTKLRVGYHLDDLNNSLQRLAPLGDTFNEFRSFTGVTVTQPVLKGAGKNAATAKVRIAEKDREIAFQVYRREMLRILAESGAAYWELAKDQTRMRIFQKSVRIAEELVALNTRRAQAGLIPESELQEAKVGLSLRRSQESEALRDLTRATNRVRAFLYRSPLQDARVITVTEPLDQQSVSADLAEHLQRALFAAPEYQIARFKAAREGIKEYFAKNQRKPQLDVKSAYGLNGLDTTTGKSNDDAFTTQHPSWSVGFEFKVPLEGGQQTAADLAVARRRRNQALIEIRTTEVELSNALHSGIKAVQLTAKQMEEHVVMVETRRKLLETEIDKLGRGLSTSRAVLQRDDDLNRILEDQLEASISHEKAVLALEVTRGTLLERFGLEAKRLRD